MLFIIHIIYKLKRILYSKFDFKIQNILLKRQKEYILRILCSLFGLGIKFSWKSIIHGNLPPSLISRN